MPLTEEAGGALECVLEDGPGALSVVFYGRSPIAGVGPGTLLRLVGIAAVHRGRLALLNPRFELLERTRS